jgi:hypothetical protein
MAGNVGPNSGLLEVSRRAIYALPRLLLPTPRAFWHLSPMAARQRRAAYDLAQVPHPRATPRVLAEVIADEMMLELFAAGRLTHALRERERVGAEMVSAIAMYDERGWLTEPAGYHRTPRIPDVRMRGLTLQARKWECLTFDSDWLPYAGEPGRDRWEKEEPNQTARVYVLRRSGPRPWVICLHGFGMGRPAMDRMLFRAATLHRELGFNVAMPILPLHGSRRSVAKPRREVPTADAMDNVHGLAQAAWDVRCLLAWLRRQGATGLGLYGISLGGYVAALTAGIEQALDCVVVGIPVADFPTLFDDQAPAVLRRQPWHEEHMAAMRQVHQVVSPLRFVPETPGSRLHLYAGKADRLLDPLHQAGALWQHWGRPHAHWFDGGHVAHVRSGDVNAFALAALRAGVCTTPLSPALEVSGDD